jgi:hypothetical protein
MRDDCKGSQQNITLKCQMGATKQCTQNEETKSVISAFLAPTEVMVCEYAKPPNNTTFVVQDLLET